MDIEIKNVSFDYVVSGQHRTALQKISLSIRSQEFVAIVGPSGCGKSTLLNLVGGFLTPTEGIICAGGKPVKKPGADRLMIFQKSALFPFYTVAQNIEYGLMLRGVSHRERCVRREAILESINLSPFANAFPKELSEGMRKLVEIGRALVLSSPVLLFDESLGSLDALKRYRMQHLVQTILLKNRPTVLWVTHDLEEAVILADRVVVMSDRPGTVAMVKEIDLPLPRTEEIRLSAAFQTIRRELFDCLSVSGRLDEVLP